MYNVNDRWNNRNRAKGNEIPNFETATVPIQGMRDNNGNAITSNTVEENVSVPSQSIAPSEVQPAIPTADIDMPAPSEYHQFQDLYSQLYEKPITPEEEDRRKRAASAVEGVGHLGNVLSAFSNLIFTGKSAPSQELPKVPDSRLQTFEDRIAEKRRMYASGLMGAKARDLQDWKDAYTMRYNQKKAIDDRAMELMKLNTNMNLQQARLQAQQDIAAKRAEETKRHNQAMESIGWTNAQTAKTNKDKVVDSAMSDDGTIYTRNAKLTDNEAMQIVQSSGLNGEDLDSFTTGVTVDVYGKPVPGTGRIDWRAAAAYALQKGMVSGEELERRGFKTEDSSKSRKENLGWGKQSGTNKTDW